MKSAYEIWVFEFNRVKLSYYYELPGGQFYWSINVKCDFNYNWNADEVGMNMVFINHKEMNKRVLASICKSGCVILQS